MRSNRKRRGLAGYGYAWWTGVGREMLLVLRLVNTHEESKRRRTMGGVTVRGAGKFAISNLNQSVWCRRPSSQQVWWHMMGEGSWLQRAGWAWPASQWCG